MVLIKIFDYADQCILRTERCSKLIHLNDRGFCLSRLMTFCVMQVQRANQIKKILFMRDDMNLVNCESKKIFGFFFINSQGNIQAYCEEPVCTFQNYSGLDFMQRNLSVMRFKTFLVPFCIEGLSKLDWNYYYVQILTEVKNLLKVFYSQSCTSCRRFSAGKHEYKQ